MRVERIIDPVAVDRVAIEAKIAAGHRVIIQFGSPGYSPELLKKINNLCGELGKNLEIRFYGHYEQQFDASHLQFLPDVVALSVDCHSHVENLSVLSDLRHLRRLSLGIFKLNCPDFLKSLPLANLEWLSLGQTVKANFNLAPLRICHALEELCLVGHTENIDHIAGLLALRTLSLGQISKKQDLKFVSDIQNLKKLTVILGGRKNILEIKNSALEELEVIRVLGFDNLENLDAFPSLRLIKIEDQTRLEKIRFMASNKSLQSLRIYNCKTLCSLDGLGFLPNLNQIFIGKTGINIDSILCQHLSPSLKTFSFYTGKQKQSAEIRKRLDALGYAER